MIIQSWLKLLMLTLATLTFGSATHAQVFFVPQSISQYASLRLGVAKQIAALDVIGAIQRAGCLNIITPRMGETPSSDPIFCPGLRKITKLGSDPVFRIKLNRCFFVLLQEGYTCNYETGEITGYNPKSISSINFFEDAPLKDVIDTFNPLNRDSDAVIRALRKYVKSTGYMPKIVFHPTYPSTTYFKKFGNLVKILESVNGGDGTSHYPGR